jgi:DNA-binding response OmpR family regulator
MKQILLFDRAMLIRMRIKEALATSNVKVHEVESEYEIFNAIQKFKNGLDLLIMDVAIDSSDGFELIRKIKEVQHDLPIVILTSSNKRTDFIKGVQAGASDYILKPFEDDVFKARIFAVMEHVSKGNIDEFRRPQIDLGLPQTTTPKASLKHENINIGPGVDFKSQKSGETFAELLKAEKYKAKKGNYPLSIFALTFENQGSKEVVLLEKHFEDIRAQLWQSDEVVHFGPHSFYGVLPFCHQEGFERFKEKMEIFLSEEAEEKAFYQQYQWHVVGLTITNQEFEDLEVDQIMELLKIEIASSLKHLH